MVLRFSGLNPQCCSERATVGGEQMAGVVMLKY